MILGKIKGRLTSFQIIILGFAGVILLGALLLMLPISTNAHISTPFDDAIFTSTSAVCVTGLVVKDTATYWSLFGQVVILVLIQIGGLGVITVASFLTMLAGKKIGLMQRQTMQNAVAAPQMGGIVRFTRFIFVSTFIVELIGVLLLLPFFCGEYGREGIWMSVFHSISAFCNAGFDLMGNKSGEFSSLTLYSDNPYLTAVICILIIVGGIGFLTWNDIVTHKLRVKEYRMQTKVILVSTLILLIIPAVIFFFIDFANEPLTERVCKSVFQAVTPRTAGFNTADLSAMTESGRAVIMLLMLVGGAPGSTAGGVKTTTIAILLVNAVSIFRKKRNVNCFGRRIDDSIIKNAATVFFLYLSLAIVSAIAICIAEKLPMQQCMFETVSAIATVGLSLGITPQLGGFAHLVLTLLMFLGRVGGLTIIFAAFSNKEIEVSKYPLENIMVG